MLADTDGNVGERTREDHASGQNNDDSKGAAPARWCRMLDTPAAIRATGRR